MLLRLGVARGFLRGQTPLESGNFLLTCAEPLRLEITRQHAVPFIDGFLPLRLSEIILAKLGVKIAQVAQNRGIVTLATGCLTKRLFRLGKSVLFKVGPAKTVEISG